MGLKLFFFFVIIVVIGILGYLNYIRWGEKIKEGMTQDKKIDSHLTYLQNLIARSDPTPDNSGDYTSDIGVQLLRTYIVTIPSSLYDNERLSPYITQIMSVTENDAETNDKLILDLKEIMKEEETKEKAKTSKEALLELMKKKKNTNSNTANTTNDDVIEEEEEVGAEATNEEE